MFSPGNRLTTAQDELQYEQEQLEIQGRGRVSRIVSCRDSKNPGTTSANNQAGRTPGDGNDSLWYAGVSPKQGVGLLCRAQRTYRLLPDTKPDCALQTGT